MKKLTVEFNSQFQPAQDTIKFGNNFVMVTPPVGENFWMFRVKVSEVQSIIAFPKFGTIGIGFAIENDWNTNLPYSCSTEKIYTHIQHNKGDRNIHKSTCIQAIEMLQSAIREYKKGK